MGDKDDMPLCSMWKRGWCFGNSFGIGNTCPRRHYYLPRDVPPPQQQRAPAQSAAWFSTPISPVNVRVLRHELTEVKTQLDADTGEERTWSETVVKEVIDLTGEGVEEEEQAAVNEAVVEEDQSGLEAHNKRLEAGREEFSEVPARRAEPAEEPLGGGCGSGDEEIAANQPDDIGKDGSNEEEVEGHKTIRAEEEVEEALSLEISDKEQEEVERGEKSSIGKEGQEGEQRNQADFEEVVKSVSTLSNTNASIEKVAAHSSFSSDTTEPWDGEGGSEEEAGENQGGDGGSASLGHDEGTPSPGQESSQMHRLDDGVSNKLDLEEGQGDIVSPTKKTRREEGDIGENEEPIRLSKKRSRRIVSDDEDDAALVVQQSHDEGTPNLESSQMQMNGVSSKLDLLLEEGEEEIVSPTKKTRREDDIEENEEPIRLPKKRSKRIESDDEDDADMVVEATQTKKDFPRGGDMEEGENNNCRNIISQLSVGAPFSLHLVQMANSASSSKDSTRTRETSISHADKGSVQMEVETETQSRPCRSTSNLPRQYTKASKDSSDDCFSEGPKFRQGTSTPIKDFPDLKVKEVRVQLMRISTPLMELYGGDISVSKKGVKRELNKENRHFPKKETPEIVLEDDTVARGDECIGCGETFANLRRHQRLNHDLPCPDDSCERSFTSEEQLRRHMAKKHLKFANGGECKTCGERFPEDLELAIHISQCGEPEENY